MVRDIDYEKIDLKPGDMFRIGSKLFGVCEGCLSIVWINKPLLGSAHFCVDEEDR